MRLLVFGATGNVGRHVVSEALTRGHAVTAVVRQPEQLDNLPAGAIGRIGDACQVNEVAALSQAQDVVINTTRSATSDMNEVRAITRALIDGLAGTGARLLVVGGAASLTVPGSDGRMVLDDARYLPPAARAVGEASLAQYQVCQADTRVDWAYLSPPALLAPGRRTGQYRLGHDELLVDDQGKSHISYADLAVVLMDEAMSPKHHQTRFTAAY